MNQQRLHGIEVPRIAALLDRSSCLLSELFANVETYCRQQADLKAAERLTLQAIQNPAQPTLFVAAPHNPLVQFWLTICEIVWRAAAGFVNGMTAGYMSHLVIDAGTPRSIPLLANGF